MKKQICALLIFSILLSMGACTKDPVVSTTNGVTTTTRNLTDWNPCSVESDINLSNLPQAAQTYLATNYPNINTNNIEQYDDNGTLFFAVKVNNNLHLLFDATGALVFEGANTSVDVSIIDLPAAVQDYVTANYPNSSIDEVELNTEYDVSYYEVELENGTTLIFDGAGGFLCSTINDHDDDDNNNGGNGNNNDDDDDDDDDDITLGNLPMAIQDYLTQNYPNYTFDEAETETLCDGTQAIEVELFNATNGTVRLYFSATGTYLFAETNLLPANLPTAIQNAINAEYAGYVIEDVDLFTMADGSLQYQVELENNATDTEVTVIFDAAGTVLCEEID